jgi:hypothetical protein
MNEKKIYVKDGNGQKVMAGDTVYFSYGIPPVYVVAKITEINGVLWALTPDHHPEKCRLNRLNSYVGGFYRQ